MYAGLNENTQVNGYVFLIDWTGFTAKHMTRWSLDDMRKWTSCWQVGFAWHSTGIGKLHTATFRKAYLCDPETSPQSTLLDQFGRFNAVWKDNLLAYEYRSQNTVFNELTRTFVTFCVLNYTVVKVYFFLCENNVFFCERSLCVIGRPSVCL